MKGSLVETLIIDDYPEQSETDELNMCKCQCQRYVESYRLLSFYSLATFNKLLVIDVRNARRFI